MRTDTPRHRWVGSAVLGALGTAAFLAVALWVSEQREFAARVYVVFIGALVVRLLVRAIVAARWMPEEPSFDLALRGRAPGALRSPYYPELIQQELGSSANRALELHYRLRPRLREITADRLATNHSVAMDEATESTRRLLGDEAWELLRPDREPPRDRLGPGMSVAELERIVTAVEGI